MKIFEIVAPTTQQYDTWYHGTNSKKRADQIIANGIKYDGDWVEKKYKMEPEFAPMKDGVYITKDLGNAYRYSIMGTHPDSYDYSSDPNGYIFKFAGSDLQSISNDEDEIGKYIVDNLNNYPELQGKITPEIIKGANDKSKTSNAFKYIAMAGKIALQNLSKDKIDTLLNTLDSINLVHYGVLNPFAVIVTPRINEEQFKKLVGKKVNSFKTLTDFVIRNGKETKLT
jgi:hypothetical protein